MDKEEIVLGLLIVSVVVGIPLAHHFDVFAQYTGGNVEIIQYPSSLHPGQSFTVQVKAKTYINRYRWRIRGKLDGEQLAQKKVILSNSWQTYDLPMTVPSDKSSGSATLRVEGNAKDAPSTVLDPDSRTITIESEGGGGGGGGAGEQGTVKQIIDRIMSWLKGTTYGIPNYFYVMFGVAFAVIMASAASGGGRRYVPMPRRGGES